MPVSRIISSRKSAAQISKSSKSLEHVREDLAEGLNFVGRRPILVLKSELFLYLAIMPSKILINVDLPAPLGPIMQFLFACNAKSIFLKISRSSRRTEIFSKLNKWSACHWASCTDDIFQISIMLCWAKNCSEGGKLIQLLNQALC